jgi:hypothetical protein
MYTYMNSRGSEKSELSNVQQHASKQGKYGQDADDGDDGDGDGDDMTQIKQKITNLRYGLPKAYKFCKSYLAGSSYSSEYVTDLTLLIHSGTLRDP